jgi:hypothetical protein
MKFVSKIKYLFGVLVAMTLTFEANAATYYVSTSGLDSNNGSQSAPWLTVGKAAGVAVAGDTVNIAAGTYTGNVTFSKSGSAGSTILFSGTGNVVVVGNINLNGNYIVLSGVTCSPPSAGGYAAVMVNGSHNVLTNSPVANYGAQPSDQAAMVNLYGSDNTVINCVYADMNDIDVFHIWGHDHSIMGCTVTNVNEANYALNHTDFVQTWGSGTYNVLISGCLVVNSTCQLGNTEMDITDGSWGWTFENCIFQNVANSYFSGIPNTKFYNCVFDNVGRNQGAPIIWYLSTVIGNQRDSTGGEVDNTVFYNCSPMSVNGVSLSTILQTGNYSGTSPGFVNEPAGDYHLAAGSRLIGTGMNLCSIFTDDMDGNARVATGAWDIGAYAYSTNTAIVSNTPTIQVNPGTIVYGTIPAGTSVTNSFMIKNVGTGTLNGSATVASPFSIASGSSYSLGAGQTQAVVVVFNPLVASNYSQSVNLSGGGGTNVMVSGNVTNPPGPPLPTVVTEKISASITNPITLQYCTNLSSPTWWTLGTFVGSTNLSFTNMPVVLIRGVCSNLSGSATLNWPASTNPLTSGYKVYYGTVSGVYPYVLNVGKARTVIISNLSQGKAYYFLVDTYNIAGAISPYLNEISATVPITSFTLSIGH